MLLDQSLICEIRLKFRIGKKDLVRLMQADIKQNRSLARKTTHNNNSEYRLPCLDITKRILKLYVNLHHWRESNDRLQLLIVIGLYYIILLQTQCWDIDLCKDYATCKFNIFSE